MLEGGSALEHRFLEHRLHDVLGRSPCHRVYGVIMLDTDSPPGWMGWLAWQQSKCVA